MNEIDVITRWCEKYGSSVDSVNFHKDSKLFAGLGPWAGTTWDIGENEGLQVDKSYFFGHVDVTISLSGTINPADANGLDAHFISYMKSRQISGSNLLLAVGSGIDILGNGAYIGYRRLYAKAFNRIFTSLAMIDASCVYSVTYEVEGYLFRMK